MLKHSGVFLSSMVSTGAFFMTVKGTLSIFFPEEDVAGLENKLNRQEYTYHQTSLRETYEKKKIMKTIML